MFYQSKGKWEENTIKDLFLSFNSYNLRARISVMILLFAPGVVSLKRLLNQSNLKSWSSKMIKKSLEAYFFTLKNKIVFCKKQFQNMSVFCFVSTEIV